MAPAAAPPAAVDAATGTPVLWVGSDHGMERALVERAGLDYAGINTGQVTGVNAAKAAANMGRMAVGVRQSLRILARFRSTVCLVTGGYVCVPVVLACRLRGVPVMIYLPDMTPGSAIRSLSRLADRVAVSFPEVAPHFGGEAPAGKAVVTGYPVRRELVDAARDRGAARRQLAALLEDATLAADALPLVLIWGGSQGARSINQATWGALPALLPHAHVLHVIGTRDWPLYEEHAATQPLTDHAARYHPVDYLHDAMPLALAAADLTVARAGASSLGEFPVAGLPSVLVPLPHAGVNQQANAALLADHGAAVVLDDATLATSLAPTVAELLADSARLRTMADAAVQLAIPDAAQRIAQALAALQRATT
ncbi:MAG: UDP-N-acetylglucosamine--N-acetylmuramyl-(pentapeptide) pyrophosphoryl-undecaprenol N-acetylglucosamine transferase [Caldilineaceae bacterium]